MMQQSTNAQVMQTIMGANPLQNGPPIQTSSLTYSHKVVTPTPPQEQKAVIRKGNMTNPTVSVGENYRDLKQEELELQASSTRQQQQNLAQHVQSMPLVSYGDDQMKRKMPNLVMQQMPSSYQTLPNSHALTPQQLNFKDQKTFFPKELLKKAKASQKIQKRKQTLKNTNSVESQPVINNQLSLSTIQRMVGGMEPDSATMTEKNVIRNIEIDTGNYKPEAVKKISKTQARNSPKNKRGQKEGKKAGSTNLPQYVDIRGKNDNFRVDNSPSGPKDGKKNQISIMNNQVGQPNLHNQNNYNADELPNNQQFQPSPGQGEQEQALPNFLLQTHDDEAQITLPMNSKFYKTNPTTYTTSQSANKDEFHKLLYPQSNNQDQFQQTMKQDSKRNVKALNSPLPHGYLGGQPLQQNFMTNDVQTTSVGVTPKTHQHRRVNRSQDMRKQARATAGQASQQIYTAKGKPNDANKRVKRNQDQVYQQKTINVLKSSPITPQEQVQSNIQGSYRNLKRPKNMRPGVHNVAINSEKTMSKRSNSQKINSFDRQYQKRVLSGFERSASLGRNGQIYKEQGSFRKIQRQQLKKSLKGIQHQLFMANKQPCHKLANMNKNRPQTTAPQKQDKGTLFLEGNNPLVETMPPKKSAKQLTQPVSKQGMARQQNNSKQMRRSIEPVIDPSQKVGVLSQDGEVLNSIKIAHRSNNSMEGQYLINSVNNGTDNIEVTEDPNDMAQLNQMQATEMQSTNLDQLIVQTYQDLFNEINIVKGTQIEDSEKLVQALETLRNFEGNNLQISERLTQMDQLTTQSLEETQKSQRALNQIVKKQLVPFIQRLHKEQKSQSDKMDAIIEASNSNDETILELRNELEQMKGQLMETMNMISEPKRAQLINVRDQSDIKEWVLNQLNQFQEKFETIENHFKQSNEKIISIEDLKHEQDHLKLQCQFHSNNIDNMQFQIQNQLKIYSNLQEFKDTQKQIKKLEQNLQHKDESFGQMNERIKEVMKKMAEMKRQTENPGQSNLSQLDERRMVKKLEDKLNAQIQSVDESCNELWQQQKQYEEIVRQQDLKFEQLKQMIDQIMEQQARPRNRRSNNLTGPSQNSNLDNFRGDSEDDDDGNGGGGNDAAGGQIQQARPSVIRQQQNDPVVRQSAFMEYLESLRAEIQVFNQDQNDQLRQQLMAQIQHVQNEQRNRQRQEDRPQSSRQNQQQAPQPRNSQVRAGQAEADQNNMFNRSQQSVQNTNSEYPRPPTEIQEDDHPHLLEMQVSNLDPNNREQVSGAASFNQMHRSQNQSQIYQNENLIENYDQLHESLSSNNNARPRDNESGEQVPHQDIINLLDQHGPANQQIQALQRQVNEMQVQLNRYEPFINQSQQMLSNFEQIQQSINLMEQRIISDEDLQAQSLQQINRIKESARFIQQNLDQILIRIQQIESELGVGDDNNIQDGNNDEQNQIDSASLPRGNLSQTEKRILKNLKQVFNEKFKTEFSQSQQNLQDIKTLQYLVGIVQDSNFQEQINNLRRFMNRYLRSNVQQQRIGIDPNSLDQLSNNPDRIDNRIDFSPNVIAVPHTDREVQPEDIFMDREDLQNRPHGQDELQQRRDRRGPNLESPHRQQQPSGLQNNLQGQNMRPSTNVDETSFQQRQGINNNNEPSVEHFDQQLEISQDHQDNIQIQAPNRRSTMPTGAVLVGPAGLSTMSHSSQVNPERQEQQQLYNSIMAINSEQFSHSALPQQAQSQQPYQEVEPQRAREPGHAARNTFLSHEGPLHDQEQRPSIQQRPSELVGDGQHREQINDSMNRSPAHILQNRSEPENQRDDAVENQLSLSAIQFNQNLLPSGTALQQDSMPSQSNISKEESEPALMRMGHDQQITSQIMNLSQEILADSEDQKILDGLLDDQRERERRADQITDEVMNEQILMQVAMIIDDIIKR